MKAGWTLQKLMDDGMRVTAYCHDETCHHSAALDLARLCDRLGPDAPAMRDDLAPKLRCQGCDGRRGKGVGLIYSPRTDPRGNPNTRAKGG